eukprot:evm.model.scf_717.6 EVM.evm.TU.scf_717.6   scf_717:49162-50532(-)
MVDRNLYTVEMDQAAALRAAASGGTVLLVGVPPGTLIGIDHRSFVVGPKFCGIKLLPPGLHLISSSSHGEDGALGPVVGRFLHASPQQVYVWRWSIMHEALVDMEDEEELERYRLGVRRFDFDSGLAPYDLGSFRVWKALSTYVDEEVLGRLSPQGRGISIVAEGRAWDPDMATTAAEHRLAEQLQGVKNLQTATGAQHSNELCANPSWVVKTGTTCAGASQLKNPSEQGQYAGGKGAKDRGATPLEDASAEDDGIIGRCSYTLIPAVIKAHGLKAEALTALNLDKSKALDEVISTKMGGQESQLLGEFQFAFLAFVMCQSLDGFGQWKRILQLMFGCVEAPIRSRTELFSKFLAALRAQLQMGLVGWGTEKAQDPVLWSGLVDDLADDNFLKHGLLTFIDIVQEAAQGEGVDASVLHECEQLAAIVEQRMGWRVSDREDDEFAPAVVELDELHIG